LRKELTDERDRVVNGSVFQSVITVLEKKEYSSSSLSFPSSPLLRRFISLSHPPLPCPFRPASFLLPSPRFPFSPLLHRFPTPLSPARRLGSAVSSLSGVRAERRAPAHFITILTRLLTTDLVLILVLVHCWLEDRMGAWPDCPMDAL